ESRGKSCMFAVPLPLAPGSLFQAPRRAPPSFPPRSEAFAVRSQVGAADHDFPEGSLIDPRRWTTGAFGTGRCRLPSLQSSPVAYSPIKSAGSACGRCHDRTRKQPDVTNRESSCAKEETAAAQKPPIVWQVRFSSRGTEWVGPVGLALNQD